MYETPEVAQSFLKQLNLVLGKDPSLIMTAHTDAFDNLAAPFRESFVLFGAGPLGRHVASGLRRLGIEPRVFADNNPQLWGRSVDGLPVLSPTDAALRFRDAAVFVISVYTSEPVRRQLRDLGVTFVPFPSLAWRYPAAFLPHYALDTPDAIFRQEDDVRRGFDVWADDASRQEYLAQLRWRTSLDPEVLPGHLPAAETYFPQSLVRLRADEIFVDCGAYDGDVIHAFLQLTGGFSRIVALEPDVDNFHRLQRFIRSLPPDLGRRCTLWPVAAGKFRGETSLNATGTVASAIGSGGTTRIDVAPLDEILTDTPPTFIKMDVEGAELDRGSRQ